LTTHDHNRRDYWDDRLRRHWGPEGVGSLPYGRSFNRWRYRVRAHVFRRLVRRLALAPTELDVLDVGCGTGFYLGRWRALGVRSLSGLDISEWAVAQLALEYPTATFYRADIGAASPLPDEAFDVVTAFDVLTHIVDDELYRRALRNLHRALRPGGVLLYSDAFLHGPSKQHEDYWKGRSLASAATCLEDCGYELVDRLPMSVVMSAPTDTRHPERNERIWNAVMRPVLWSDRIGWLAGAVLCPVDLLLTSTLRESPGNEIAVCRKAEARA
jgi:SAM-dependent methyltransferase